MGENISITKVAESGRALLNSTEINCKCLCNSLYLRTNHSLGFFLVMRLSSKLVACRQRGSSQIFEYSHSISDSLYQQHK